MEISLTDFWKFLLSSHVLFDHLFDTRYCCHFSPPYGSLNFVFSFLQVLIVMTDGISQDSVVKSSRALRNAGVRILALGIGTKFRRAQLNQMAANPRYVFKAGFRSLHRVVRSIKRTACGGNYLKLNNDNRE